MDGTVTREVLDAVLEEAHPTGAELGAGGGIEPWASLGAKIQKGEKERADYFRTAANPYGSEFAYDTTGQEEVVVWLLYFGYGARPAPLRRPRAAVRCPLPTRRLRSRAPRRASSLERASALSSRRMTVG